MAAKTKKKTKIREELFARAYAADSTRNGSKAAIAAGYSKNGAHVIGSALLRRPTVQARINELLAKHAEKLDISGEKVIRELALIGFARAKDYIDEKNNFVGMACLTSEQSAALDFISDENGTRIRMADKKASLELLGKHLKLFGADDHGASTAVKVIIVNSPRPLRPAGAIAVQVEQGNGHSGNGHKNEPPEIE